jgi:flagellar motor switch protein FliN/FliY
MSAELLMRLGASTAEAVAKALDQICPEPAQRGDVAVVAGCESPFAAFEGPAIAVSVAYVDGVTGGNVLLMTPLGARRVAAAMSGEPAPGDDDHEAEPTELELSAVAEAANQMMAAAASATSVVLGQDVEIAPPETRAFASAAEAPEAYDVTPHATAATFVVCGEPCRLVQLIPNAFVVRMTRAFDEQGAEQLSGGATPARPAGAAPGEQQSLGDALRDIRVRVWAELGRTRVPLGQAPELPPGAVLELDRKADDPVDLYVNGLRFARGQLVLTDEGEWALRLDQVTGREQDFRPPVAASGRPGDEDFRPPVAASGRPAGDVTDEGAMI